MTDVHIFALFSSQKISHDIQSGEIFELRDQDLWTRIVRVLRLGTGEFVILFDLNYNIVLELLPTMFERKGFVIGRVKNISKNQLLEPEIHLYPCLLKKEAFEDMGYVAAQMGVTSITPVLSEKIQRKWGSERELERLGKIMIAACEQSKNFVLPRIYKPMSFNDVITQKFDKISSNIVFYEAGQPLNLVIKNLSQTNPINLMFGPEGGFSSTELEQLNTSIKTQDIKLCALTPTILRAREAIILGIGIVRSITS